MDKSIDDALAQLREAVGRAKYRREAELQGRRLEQSLKKAFREQGKVLVRGLRRELKRFFEAPAPIPGPSPKSKTDLGEGSKAFEAHAAFLAKPLRENASENEWLLAWLEAEQETARLFIGPIDAAVTKALEAGALAAIASLRVKLSFDLKNPRAVRYLNEYGARLVKGLNETTRADLRTLISDAANEGWSWKRLEQEIEGQFADYIKSNGRAHLIATTEIGEAFSEGNLIVARDLQAAGLEMEKMWDPAGDGCETICGPNAAQSWIPLDQAFASGHDRPLGHPGCFCDMLTRLVKNS